MRLEPGATINEKEICARLEISRTPLREAILRLVQEGLVRSVPGGGTFVNKITIRKVIEGYLVRSSLELRIIGHAARTFTSIHEKDMDLMIFRQKDAGKRRDIDDAFQVDNEFHRLLCKIAGFPNIWQTIHAATGQLDRVRRLAFPKIGYFDEVSEEHMAIYTAMKANDDKAAFALLKAHMDGIVPVVQFVMETVPDAVVGEADLALLDAVTRI